MNRTLLSVGVVVGVFALGVGAGTLTRPDSGRADGQSGDRWVSVQNTVAVCPDPVSDGLSASWIGAATPPREGASAVGGEATVADLGAPARVRTRVTKPGSANVLPVTGSDLPPLVGNARGTVAAGFTMQQTTSTQSGGRRGLASTACAAPGTDFWFVGTSTVPQRITGLFLTNSEQVPAAVDLFLYGPKGPIDTPGGRNLLIAPGKQRGVLLGALAAGVTDLSVHVVVRSGRVAAAVRDQESAGRSPKGVDWLPVAGEPATRVVVPAAPANSAARLYLLAPGEDDGTAKVKLVGKDGSFTPVGAESVQLSGGNVTAVDLTQAARSESVAVQIDSEVPVLAGMRLVRARGVPEVGFLAAAPALRNGAVIPDSGAGSAGTSTLYLTAPGREARVTVITMANGAPRREEVVVPPGTTLPVVPKPPAGASGYAVVVTPWPDTGAVHGSWAQIVRAPGGELFSTLPLVDNGATVLVPRVGHDLSAGISPER